MAFWWVNHKQTFRVEIKEGYIWSPKRNNDNTINQTYLNLTRAQPKDIVFSYARGEIIAIGIVERPAIEGKRPEAFGSTGEQWSPEGWTVSIQWQRLPRPFIPRKSIHEIAPLLPDKYSPIRANGKGNQGVYLAGLSEVLGNLLLESISEGNENVEATLIDTQTSIEEAEQIYLLASKTISETFKEQLIKARLGQGRFRMEVEEIEKCCRLTNVSHKTLLIASHIKPWRDSNNQERLDGHNGLLLSPHVDKLFDKGYISFSSEGQILVFNQQVLKVMRDWSLDPDKKVGDFTDKQKQYLAFHRDHIFESGRF